MDEPVESHVTRMRDTQNLRRNHKVAEKTEVYRFARTRTLQDHGAR